MSGLISLPITVVVESHLTDLEQAGCVNTAIAER